MGTDADKVRSFYKAVGEVENHTYGVGPPGTKPPDFNIKLPGGASAPPAKPAGAATPPGTARATPSANPPNTPPTGKAPDAARRANQAAGAPPGRRLQRMSYPDGRILLNSQREGQVSRFRFWVLLAVPLAAILFQAYVPLFFQFLRYLEVPLLVVVYFAIMRRSQISGLLIGAVVGLAQDSLSTEPLGMYGIAKTLVGYFAASVGMRLDVDHPVIRLLLCFFFYIVHQFFYWVILRAMFGKPLPFDVQNTLVLALLNAVVGVSLFHFLDKLREPA